MLIRQATVGDIPSIGSLLRSMEPESQVIPRGRLTLRDLRDLIVECPAQAYVAEDTNGAIVGCVFVSDEGNMIHCLAVDKAHRRRGIATRLLQEILRDYYRRTRRKAIVLTVSPDNKLGLDFWGTFCEQEGTDLGQMQMIAFVVDLEDQPWL